MEAEKKVEGCKNTKAVDTDQTTQIRLLAGLHGVLRKSDARNWSDTMKREVKEHKLTRVKAERKSGAHKVMCILHVARCRSDGYKLICPSHSPLADSLLHMNSSPSSESPHVSRLACKAKYAFYYRINGPQ